MKKEVLEWLKSIVFAFILVYSVNYFVFSPIIVDGESMMPTLEDKSRMVLNKINYVIKEPERFDIIVFHGNEKEDYIKRIIGLPGDHIEYKDDVLYINGKAHNEPYLERYKQNDETVPFTYDFTLEDTPGGRSQIPDNHYFVLGDNRKDSIDSRVIGVIPFESVVGEASVVVWPLKNIGIVK